MLETWDAWDDAREGTQLVEARDLANGAHMLWGRIGLMGLAMMGVGGGKKGNKNRQE